MAKFSLSPNAAISPGWLALFLGYSKALHTTSWNCSSNAREYWTAAIMDVNIVRPQVIFWLSPSTPGRPYAITTQYTLNLNIYKTFDGFWHGGLLVKLSTFGFPLTFLLWRPSFPEKRTISNPVDGVRIHPFLVNPNLGLPTSFYLLAIF